MHGVEQYGARGSEMERKSIQTNVICQDTFACIISSPIKHTALGGYILYDEMGQDVLEASYWIYKGPGWSPRGTLPKDTKQVTSHKN